MRDEGDSLFFDRFDLPPGEAYDGRIQEAIASCDLFVFLITPQAVSRGTYTLAEVSIAERASAHKEIRVLPVMVARTEFAAIPPFLRGVTVLEPKGDIAAETLALIGEIRDDVERRTTSSRTNRSARDDSVRGAATGFRSQVLWAVAVVLGLVLAAMGIALWRETRQRPAPIHLSIVPPVGHEFQFELGGAPMISPDGTMIVFAAVKDGMQRLWLRRLGSPSAEPLVGTEGAINPFWSPDSRSIGFFSKDQLLKLDIGRDAPAIICDVPFGRGGSWNADGTILFAGRATPIMRIPATGGVASVAVTEFDASQGDTTHRWPLFLPDGRHFLFMAAPSGARGPNAICVGSVDHKMRKVITTSDAQPIFLNGYLLLARNGTLQARRFDFKKLELIDRVATLSEGQIGYQDNESQSFMSVSDAGTLVYQMIPSNQYRELTWFSRTGQQIGTVGDPGLYGPASLSSDGRFLYVGNALESPLGNIWSYDLENDATKTRITFGDNTWDSAPVVSADGTRIVYYSAPLARSSSELRLRDLVNGTETSLLQSDELLYVNDWSADGHWLIISNIAIGSGKRADLWSFNFDDHQLRPYLQTPFIESGGHFSPDGKWVAYHSDQSGRFEVYLAPFPPSGAKWQISVNGGSSARWRADGRELFYFQHSDGRVMAVSIILGVTPRIGRAAPLFAAHSDSAQPFVVTRDGQRFLLARKPMDEPQQPLTVVLNFDQELAAAMKHR